MLSKIIGVGGYLPKKLVTNNNLTQQIDTSNEWITSRTGIKQRYIASDEEYTSHMAYQASIKAINNSKIDPSALDLIILCTNTPDHTFPSTANKIQGYLNIGNIPSFDLQAICSGFIYGTHIANLMIKSGQYKTILVVCADKMSSIIDWQDRKTCILFGDGAGAIILQANNKSSSGIIDSCIYSDGTMHDILYTSGGVSSNKKSGVIKMKGSEVFRQAIEKMTTSIYHILSKNNISIQIIDYFIPHQANIRIINSIRDKLKIDNEKVITTIAEHANCSAGSIPLALYKLSCEKKIKEGSILLFSAFGGGTSWGSMLVKW